MLQRNILWEQKSSQWGLRTGPSLSISSGYRQSAHVKFRLTAVRSLNPLAQASTITLRCICLQGADPLTPGVIGGEAWSTAGAPVIAQWRAAHRVALEASSAGNQARVTTAAGQWTRPGTVLVSSQGGAFKRWPLRHGLHDRHRHRICWAGHSRCRGTCEAGRNRIPRTELDRSEHLARRCCAASGGGLAEPLPGAPGRAGGHGTGGVLPT